MNCLEPDWQGGGAAYGSGRDRRGIGGIDPVDAGAGYGTASAREFPASLACNLARTIRWSPWLERLERQMTERVLDGFLREIPPEWYADDYGALSRLAEQLHSPRTRVPDLILEAKRSTRQPFPN